MNLLSEFQEVSATLLELGVVASVVLEHDRVI